MWEVGGFVSSQGKAYKGGHRQEGQGLDGFEHCSSFFFFLNCIMTGIENQTINKQKTTLYVFQWKIEPVSRAATRCDGLAHFFGKFPTKNGILGLNKPTQQLV